MKIQFVIIALATLLTGCGQAANQPSQGTRITVGPQITTTSTASTASAPAASAATTAQREFTLDELKKFNGQNGSPAYVAVNGKVYDVTNSRQWRNGLHSDCSNSTYAGADFTDLISSSPHGAAIMSRIPVVGTLKK